MDKLHGQVLLQTYHQFNVNERVVVFSTRTGDILMIQNILFLLHIC
jgi:hypothetical protein